MEARAIAKGLRIPPRKARLIIDLVRGKSVVEADRICRNYNSEAARLTLKVLTSAVANAENNHFMNRANLYVAEIYANKILQESDVEIPLIDDKIRTAVIDSWEVAV